MQRAVGLAGRVLQAAQVEAAEVAGVSRLDRGAGGCVGGGASAPWRGRMRYYIKLSPQTLSVRARVASLIAVEKRWWEATSPEAPVSTR